MSYNRQAFSVDLPNGLGNGHPTDKVRRFILGWIAAEFDSCDANCDIGCANNPLAMADHTSNFPGTTLCNNLGGGFGVLNFPTYHEGLNALVGRLRQQNYSHVRQAIIMNDETALGFTGHMSNGVASDLAVWVHGNRDIPGASSYINNILTRAGAAKLSTSTSMGNIPGTNDPCLACGAVGSAKYTQCHAALAAKVGNVPACAKAAIAQNQQDLANAVKDVASTITNPLNFLPGWTDNPVRVVKLLVGVMLIGLAILMLIAPDALDVAKLAAI